MQESKIAYLHVIIYIFNNRLISVYKVSKKEESYLMYEMYYIL